MTCSIIYLISESRFSDKGAGNSSDSNYAETITTRGGVGVQRR
ncbi:MAG: hypothetical protein WBL67_08765 [Nitrososphaeraceae archaeon]